MNEPPKPGRLLVANSVVVIALCAWAVAAGLAEGFGRASARQPSTGAARSVPLGALPLLWIPVALAAWQHRAVFRRDPRSAQPLLAVVTLVAALGWLWTIALGLLLMLRAPRTAELTTILIVMSAVAAYMTFTAWLNWRWYRSIAATSVSPRPRQFSIRDLLAITIWIAVVAGLARWMMLSGM